MIRPRPPSPVRGRTRQAAPPPEAGWQQIASFCAVTAACLLFLLTAVTSWLTLPMLGLAPFWLYGVVFVVSLRRPDLLPSGVLFLTGLLSDIVIGTPLGLMALMMVGLSLGVRLQRRYLMTQSFVVQWVDYGLISLGLSVFSAMIVLWQGAGFEALATSLLNVVLTWILLMLAFPLTAMVVHAVMSLMERFGR